jgi:hypothetical protein
MTLIGIDPGSSGGIAWTDSDGEFHAVKMPETVGDLVDTLRTLRVEGCHTAWCEKVASSPQMGVCSAFSFGRGVGNIEAACQALGIRLELVSPSKWQSEMGCLQNSGSRAIDDASKKKDKNVTKNKAQQLHPTVKVTHAIADALLICEYGHRQAFAPQQVESPQKQKKTNSSSTGGSGNRKRKDVVCLQ